MSLARAGRHAGKGVVWACNPALGGIQLRELGGGVPEFWGRKSKYTEGTDFLGTPPNHMDLVHKRPLSPDVFDINGGTMYHFPITAVTSILNRVTGVVLSGAWTAMGALALTGDLVPVVDTIAASPVLCTAAKFGLAFPLSYHYWGGIRHLIWDHSNLGLQSEKTSLMEKRTAPMTSAAVLAASVATGAALAAL